MEASGVHPFSVGPSGGGAGGSSSEPSSERADALRMDDDPTALVAGAKAETDGAAMAAAVTIRDVENFIVCVVFVCFVFDLLEGLRGFELLSFLFCEKIPSDCSCVLRLFHIFSHRSLLRVFRTTMTTENKPR